VVFALLVLILASAADARLGMKGNAAVASGMALAFGLLVGFNATPAAAVGPAVGGVILGAMAGALSGAISGAIVRRWVPAAKRRPARADERGQGAAGK
jgi:hypothetical protein